MKTIAYLVPIYPMPSQTFIRREIAALESRGWTVHRFANRRYDRELVEPADRADLERTTFLLDSGAGGLLRSLLAEAISRPGRWATALRAAVRLGRRSEKGLLRHLVYLAEATVLRRHLAARGVEHLHIHFGTNSSDIALFCRLLGGPAYSITIHGPEEFDSPAALGLGEKVRHAAFVVAISHYTRSQLYRWAATEDWGRIHVVRCGLDEVFLAGQPEPVPARPRLVSIGRLAEQKGQLLLVEAAARLRARCPDFELLIIGDGPMRGELERAIARHGLEDQVRITGFLDNQAVRRELEAARALVLPSFAEGLPVVIMEALTLGRPAIATWIAGIPELVEPGQNGWLVPAGAVDPLVDAMAEVLEAEPSELGRMGQAGAARARAQHNAAVEVEKLARLIEGPAAGDRRSNDDNRHPAAPRSTAAGSSVR